MTEADMKIPFMDLRVTDTKEKNRMLNAINEVFEHGRMVLGPEVKRLEEKIAMDCGRQFAVGVSSGSTALHLAMKCLDIGPRDEVITTSLSWVATANAVASVGAKPVFVDIKNDLNMNPEKIRGAISPRTKAILAVHWTGKICDMTSIKQIADDNGLFVIEDAAQAYGSSLCGQKAGSFGVLGCFSMNAMKVLASCSDSGMLVTDQNDLYNRLNSLRYAGTINREECVEISLNGRMDTLEAAILLVRLEKLDEIIRKRREVVGWYNEGLQGIVDTPKESENSRDVLYTYVIQTKKRSELREFLRLKGIETKIHHPILLPQQPVYEDVNNAEHYPVAMRAINRILSLPSTEKITKPEVEYVISSFVDILLS